jgi:hypothetical protein
MKKMLLSVFLSAIILNSRPASAQKISDDTTNYLKAAIAATRAQFTKTISANAYLYNGTAYARYWNGVVGYPFFEAEGFQKGDIYYNGIFYEEIPLMYDLFRDVLITKTFSKEDDMNLLGEKLTAFSLGTHFFVKISPDSAYATGLKTGFYEKIYTGGISAFVRHEKRIEKSLKVDENFSKFTQYDHYYIEKDGLFHAIDGESDLQSVLKDQKQEIKKFLNRKEIRYKKDPAATIIQVAAFYDGLKK